jgi:hypothetical protein
MASWPVVPWESAELGLSAVSTFGLPWRQKDGSPGSGSYQAPVDSDLAFLAAGADAELAVQPAAGLVGHQVRAPLPVQVKQPLTHRSALGESLPYL